MPQFCYRPLEGCVQIQGAVGAMPGFLLAEQPTRKGYPGKNTHTPEQHAAIGYSSRQFYYLLLSASAFLF